MIWEIPGRETLRIEHIIWDFNGTLAVDGQVDPAISALLQDVARVFSVRVATADTFGTAPKFAEGLGIPWHRVTDGQEKAALVRSLGGAVAAIGNGENDAAMFQAADLAIAVMGLEGCALSAIQAADLLMPSIASALALFLHPQRLVATLRM